MSEKDHNPHGRVEIGSTSYFCIRGSGVDRDGMYLELSDGTKEWPGKSVLLEVFYSDQTSEMTLTSFKEAVPLEAVEWLIARAKEVLPPKAKGAE